VTAGATAVIGAGNICQTAHLPTLTRLGVPIACIVDPSDRALAAAGRIAPQCGRLVSSAELEVPAGVGRAIVCSPASLHAAHVRSLLERGLHVFCEKPLALTGREAGELAALASRLGLVLQVGYYRRFHPAARAARALLSSREFGPLRRISAKAGHVMNEGSPAMLDRQLAGGGVLADFGVHILDRLTDWFGALPMERYSDDDQGAGMEANALLRLRGGSGAGAPPIEVALSRTNDLGYFIRLEFEAGIVTNFLNLGYALRVDSAAAPVSLPRTDPAPNFGVAAEPGYLHYFAEQWKEFSARIAGAPESLSSLNDAVLTSDLLERCYRSRGRLRLACGW
jgi:predicted dehydrogenase